MYKAAWTIMGMVALCCPSPAQERSATALPPVEDQLTFGWEAAPEQGPFRAGNWVAMATGSGTVSIATEEATFYGAQFGIGYYFVDNISFNVLASGLYGDSRKDRFTEQEKGEFYGASVEFFCRDHLCHYGSWSLFVDIGLGFAMFDHPVPVGGTRYNFILTGGGGLAKQLDENTHLILGTRWQHLSNGTFFNEADTNPGFDGLMLFAGLQIGF